MFEESLIETGGQKKATKKWLTFPISLLIHVTLVTAIIIVPLMTADTNLPEISVTNVFMTAPPPSSPPPPPAARRRSSRSTKKKSEEQKKKEEKKREIQAGRLVAPIEIPEEIEEEDISDFGYDGGIDGGVEGGVEGGVVGGVLGSALLAENTEVIAVTTVQRPKRIKMVKPKYPQVALQARIQKTVIIEATTDIYGRVARWRIITGHPLLNQSAIDAIRQWVYEPYIINGITRPVKFVVNVVFSIRGQ